MAMLKFLCSGNRAVRTAAIGLLTFCGIASAHHSFAMFNPKTEVTLKGTVREFQFTNPHCWIQLLVPGPNGTTTEWSIEMGAPAHVVASGWTRKTVKPGDKISVVIHPLRNGAKGGSFISASDSNGHKL